MSRKPAKKIINAPRKNLPTAKLAAAPKFTTSPRNVNTFGLIPVAAIAPTILSSSHLLPVPIAPVRVAIFGWESAYSARKHARSYPSAASTETANRDFPQANLETEFRAAASLHRFFGIDLLFRASYI